MKRLFFFMIFALCATSQSYAEKADSTKPTNIEANQMTYDDVKQVNVFTGNVVMTRGTMLVKAERVVVTQDPEGYQYAVLYAAPGKLASYRQKRDGGPNLWMEGYGERIEYDNKTEIAKFFSKARLKRLDGDKTTDDVTGEFISYDSKTEFFSVNNTSKGVSEPGAGRIKVVIQPKEKPGQQKKKKATANTSNASCKAADKTGTGNTPGTDKASTEKAATDKPGASADNAGADQAGTGAASAGTANTDTATDTTSSKGK